MAFGHDWKDQEIVIGRFSPPGATMNFSEKLGEYSIDCQHCLFWEQLSMRVGDGYCRRFPPGPDTPVVSATRYCGEGIWILNGQVMSITEAVTEILEAAKSSEPVSFLVD
jgi:hypothetical protein